MQGKFNLISLVMNFKIAFVSSDNLFYVLQCTFPPPLQCTRSVPILLTFCSLLFTDMTGGVTSPHMIRNT